MRHQRVQLRRFAWRSFQVVKHSYQRIRFHRGCRKRVLFIVGCQRSGTTMMLRIFSRDLSAKVYPEFSPIVCHQGRLRSAEALAAVFDADRAPLIVLKPLIDTQRIVSYLERVEGSMALWMYRHYDDVTASYLDAFGNANGINDLRPMLCGDDSHWTSENLSARTRRIVRQHYSDAMSPHDATALGWWVRNSLVFDLNLDRHPKVTMCDYNSVVRDTQNSVRRIYRFMGMGLPRSRIPFRPHARSVGRGSGVRLSEPIDTLCSELWHRMREVDR